MNFVVPKEGCGCPRLEEMLRRFLDPKEEKFRNDRMKLVPKIVEGPWLFRNAVPNGAAIISKAVPVSYFFQDTDKYMEITMHVTHFRTNSEKFSEGVSNASLLQ